MLPEEAAGAVRAVVAMLTTGAYTELESLTEGRDLGAAAMAAAVEGSGRTLISPPAQDLADPPAAELDAGAEFESAYRVDVPLWTAQEGRSTLTVRLVLLEVLEKVWTVRILAIDDSGAARG
ncbi:DUF7668 domain-containing protein [Actinomadura parmotrematis]|uniref:DUF7668 domain-containing protein n=1 Tax=Actinomadura parmotrematis TaxID=2864039 RepID=A0ABS7G3S4_9ACTN|nr:hypothetical protein [Actinomadura parmotrematis]MBW8486462.1 hypothetical protein [Actinomadura parmotrematis]